MKTVMNLFAGGVVVAFAIGNLMAAPLIDWQDGSAGKTYTGWQAGEAAGFTQEGAVNMGTGGVGVNVGGKQSLAITTNTVGDYFPTLGDTFSTAAFGANANMTAYGPSGVPVGVQFQFYVDTVAPAELGFFFQNNNNYWYYDIYPITGSGWQTYGASFDYGTGWRGYENNLLGSPLASGVFNTDITSVDRLGLFIVYEPNKGQTFGVHEFGMTVPEPETYLVLGMALLSVAFIFRKKITDSLAEARAMIQM